MMQQLGLVAFGGAIGAALRYSVSIYLSGDGFPWATLSVNMIGSLLLGIVAVALTQGLISQDTALILGTGVLGAFTTMSAFSVETLNMFQNQQISSAIIYVAITMVICPILALLGWKMGEMFIA
ncbi:MAG: fluoride efflux transporter CrcB [Euryarchaeota archaeon]|jgi:CrcB protein|nr:fluoride efflux transporter CrcB [Euryarchaeota archaeon]MDG1545949.1 fluoride efflux transporter CrcB [Candidatus Poseidoniaceae archaeon]